MSNRMQAWVTEEQLAAKYGELFDEVTDGLHHKVQYLDAMNDVAFEHDLSIHFLNLRGHDGADTDSGDWEWLVSVEVDQ